MERGGNELEHEIREWARGADDLEFWMLRIYHNSAGWGSFQQPSGTTASGVGGVYGRPGAFSCIHVPVSSDHVWWALSSHLAFAATWLAASGMASVTTCTFLPFFLIILTFRPVICTISCYTLEARLSLDASLYTSLYASLYTSLYVTVSTPVFTL